jgi:hypothetical protein
MSLPKKRSSEIVDLTDESIIKKPKKELTESEKAKKKAKYHERKSAELQRQLDELKVELQSKKQDDEPYSENDDEVDDDMDFDLTAEEKHEAKVDEANIRYTRSMTKVSTDAELEIMKQKKEDDEYAAEKNHVRITSHMKVQNELLLSVKREEQSYNLKMEQLRHECKMKEINTSGMFKFLEEIVKAQVASGEIVTEASVKSLMDHGTKYLHQ